MDGLPGRFAEIWGSLSTTRRVLLAVTGGAVVGLGLLLYSWSSSTQYVTLYSGLEPEDSGRIVDGLNSRGVPYELQGGGTTVRVPEAELDELRIEFATEGLPQGGNVGFELFDGNAFTATDFVQRLNFQRGLQGELARSIETFQAVEQARVHVVLPERTLFRNEQSSATASVVLKLKPGMALSSAEVSGVAHLVSGAVEGLDREQITIIDTSGAILYDGSEVADAGSGVAASRLEMQHNYEQALQGEAQSLLDRSLGAGRGAVSVRVAMDFDRLETETEVYDPGADESGVPRSQTTVEESYSTDGADVSVGAVPGAVANVPGADTEVPPGGTTTTPNTTDYSRNETTTNFEVGKTVTRTERAPGDIEKISLSLLLDDAVPEDQVAPLTDAVAAAVGLDQERGDTVAVTRFAFDRTAIEEAEAAFAAESSSTQILSYVRLGLPLAVLLIAFIFFRLLMRSVGKRSYQVQTAPQRALAVPAGGGAVGAPAAAPALAAPPPPAKSSEVEQRVSGLVNEQPERVADVVQAWIRED